MARNDGAIRQLPGIGHDGTEKFCNDVTRRRKRKKAAKKSRKANRRKK